MIGLAAAWAAPYHADHHHADADWSTIETRFFRVHYATSDEFDSARTAAEVARIADGLLLAIGDRAGWIPRGPVHVVVSDHADGSTAFGVPPWRWIVLSADPGSLGTRLRGRLDWVEDALAHELGHVVGHRLAGPFAPTASTGIDIEGTVGAGASGMGFAVPVGARVPYGWSEGAAEAWSEAVGVNRATSERRAVLRTSALEGRLLGWDEWLAAPDDGDTFVAERATQQGWDFARWLAARGGRDVFAEMARSTSERWPGGWSRALARSTGAPARETWAEWLDDLTRRTEAEAAALRTLGLVEGEPAGIGPDGPWELHPRTSADGRWTAEAHVGWVRVVRGGEDWLWIPAAFGSAFSFVPGRDAVVVAAPQGSERASPFLPQPLDRWNQLYVVDLATPGRMRPVPGTLRARDPAVSPDGRLVAWLASADGTTNLWVAHLDGSGARALSAFDDGTWLASPGFSPAGDEIVVSAYRAGRGDLYAVALGTGAWTRLTDTAEDELDPTWAADGLWFTSDPDGVRDVYRLAPDGRIDRMTRVLGGAATPWVTPAGNLLYTATTADGFRAMEVARDELLFQPAGEAVRGAAPEVAPGPSTPPARRYDPARSLLPPTIAPVLRLDVGDHGAVPLGGARARARDAVERADLQLVGLAGEDLYGQGRFTWRGFPPEVAVWASAERDGWRMPDLGVRTVAAAGALVAGRWREGVAVTGEATVVGLRTDGDPALSSRRLGAGVSAGEPPEAGDLGAHGVVGLTRGWSAVPLGTEDDGERLQAYDWWRLELDLAGVAGRERAHRLEWRVHARAVDRNVSAEEEPKAGGDLPLALRLGVVEPSAPLPGYGAFAVSGERLGIWGVRWVVPVARLRAGAGAFRWSGVEAALGGDGAAVASFRVGRASDPRFLPDGVGELRLRASLSDARWDSFARLAWGTDGPRVAVGVGTGW